jgi:hypothetical protein
MLFSSTLFALFLAGVSQAAPAPSSNVSTPAISSSVILTTSTKSASSVLPTQSTAAANGTASAKFSASNFTDVAPSINPNATLDEITKSGMRVPLLTWVL